VICAAPLGLIFSHDGIGYKYAAPLGLSDFSVLNDIANSEQKKCKKNALFAEKIV
jgi:hypothetical protein